jgi:hypothetical protein
LQRVTFSAFGTDDRHDMVEWFRNADRRIGSWVDIEVVDEPEPALPRRGPKRKRMDWNKFFARMRTRVIRRVAKLEARLRRLRAGSQYHAPCWTMAEPTRAFRVLRNGRKLAEVSVNRPGTIHVSVHASQSRGRQAAFLRIHGGDRLGPYTYRWYAWPANETPLKLGDRVRIAVVHPHSHVLRKVRAIDCLEPSSIAEITDVLKRLRGDLASDYYRKEATSMRSVKRRPAREYVLAPRSQSAREKIRRS